VAKVPSIRKKRHQNPAKEAAVAVAAAGAAAVGGKLAWDKLSAKPDCEREYRLHVTEFLPDGIRRIARGQLDNASERLEGASDRNIGEAIHETRKSLKRLRALLRISRDGIGDDTYRLENSSFRQTGRQLSGARDSKVLVETLDGLGSRAGDELAPDTTAPLRSHLESEHERALATVAQNGVVEAVLTELKSARDRTARWTLEVEGFDALSPGIERIYRRGRKRMRAVAADPSTENLHEWRKRVKDFWHVCQISRPAAPKKLKKLGRRAHHLSDLLGEDHDLAVLRDYVEAHPRSLASTEACTTLQALIDRRRRVLQEEALEVGAVVFGKKPKRFAKSLERGWQKGGPKNLGPALA
jgi:CHAD domain-containing protein